MKKLFLFLFSVTFFVNAVAQYSAGLKYYNRFDYYKAISKFKKVKPSSKNRPDALVKAADCYFMVRDFKNATLYYKMAIESGANEALTHYHYGLALKSNNQYEEALKEFSLYLKDNPSDSKAKNAVKSCTEMKAALIMPLEYKTTNLKEINTKNSELCPVVFDKGLAFISYTKNELVNIDKFKSDGVPLLSMYYAPLTNDSSFSKKKSLSNKLNSDFHDGPLCFSADLNTLFFTRVEYLKRKKGASFTNQPKIFLSVKNGKSWQKPIAFPYNSDDYCMAPPSNAADGKSL